MNVQNIKMTGKEVEAPIDSFAATLRELMMKKRISASDLAREVWGTAKDKRGYEVARNRDRIGHYLSGASFPEAANLAKIAKALGVKVEVFEKLQPAPAVRSSSEPKAVKDIQVIYTDGIGIVSMIKLRLSPKSVATIMEIIGADPVHKMHFVPKDLIHGSFAKNTKAKKK